MYGDKKRDRERDIKLFFRCSCDYDAQVIGPASERTVCLMQERERERERERGVS